MREPASQVLVGPQQTELNWPRTKPLNTFLPHPRLSGGSLRRGVSVFLLAGWGTLATWHYKMTIKDFLYSTEPRTVSSFMYVAIGDSRSE